MAHLHEYIAKSLLAQAGIGVPQGRAVASASEAVAVARELGGEVMVKAQAWVTGRAGKGGVARAGSAQEAGEHAGRMLGLRFGNFPVTHVLIERRLKIERELFVSLAIDERARAPMVLLSGSGGSGVEDRARDAVRVACSVKDGPDAGALRQAIASMGIEGERGADLERVVRRVFETARRYDARSIEINPLVVDGNGRLVAADCRMTVDDYAAANHPELGVEIARELDHPPTELERIAYGVEQRDHRGTFFFAQMNTSAPPVSAGLIGFHGAGGGGSMMSMDAASNEGFTVANFCDTSGNPSPAKVYRAARIILEQPGLVGYFGSGSGVANQEQYWSAYGLAKAFWELELSIPAVIRLGGNTEDRAVEILRDACRGLPGRVEGYKKDDAPAKIAARLGALVREHIRSHGEHAPWKPRAPRRPAYVGRPGTHTLALKSGTVHIDAEAWRDRRGAVIARSGGLLRDRNGGPEATLEPDELAMKDSEFIACEVECRRDGIDGVFVELDVPGLSTGGAGRAGG